MAAFSYQHHPFLLDSVFMPNPLIKMPCFLEESNNESQFYQPEPLQEIPVDVSIHESSCTDQNNRVSLTNKHSIDSSSVVDKVESGDQVTQKVTLKSMDKRRKNKNGSSSSLDSAQSKDTREVKGKKQKKSNGVMKNGEEKKPRAGKKVSEEAPTDYIHVRARRGQATDSHSLAERVRRERISERMKVLQTLVPGCDKVTGKALMLEEIINYVQSLQNQVEFLSMKLASVNPIFYDFGTDLDTFMVKPERLSNYPVLDNSTSLVFQQGQMPNAVSQCTGQLSWDGISNNLCFPLI